MELKKYRPLGLKQGVEYWADIHGTIFSEPIDQSNMIGGGAEQERNDLENPVRLERVLALNKNPMVLDFGCGHGLFVNFLQDHNVAAAGYDKFVPDKNISEFDYGRWDVITLIEVIEHITAPFDELDLIYNLLKPGGLVMIETSFSDWLTIESPYVNPEAGHNTVWSHAGLDIMMRAHGFEPGDHINRNVRIYKRPEAISNE